MNLRRIMIRSNIQLGVSGFYFDISIKIEASTIRFISAGASL